MDVGLNPQLTANWRNESDDSLAKITRDLEEAKALKEAGNLLYKSNDMKRALRKYHHSLLYIKAIKTRMNGEASVLSLFANRDQALDVPGQILQDYKTTLISVYNNLSATLLASKNSDPAKIKLYSDAVIEVDPDNAKAWSRKAQALMRLENYPSAMEAFEKCLNVSDSPISDKIKIQMKTCEEKMVKYRKEESEMCKKMFSFE